MRRGWPLIVPGVAYLVWYWVDPTIRQVVIAALVASVVLLVLALAFFVYASYCAEAEKRKRYGWPPPKKTKKP